MKLNNSSDGQSSSHHTAHTRPSAQEIAWKAYLSFINQGSQHGHDVQHWLAAEEQLLAERAFARQLDHASRADLASRAPVAQAALHLQPRGSSHHVQG